MTGVERIAGMKQGHLIGVDPGTSIVKATHEAIEEIVNKTNITSTSIAAIAFTG